MPDVKLMNMHFWFMVHNVYLEIQYVMGMSGGTMIINCYNLNYNNLKTVHDRGPFQITLINQCIQAQQIHFL